MLPLWNQEKTVWTTIPTLRIIHICNISVHKGDKKWRFISWNEEDYIYGKSMYN